MFCIKPRKNPTTPTTPTACEKWAKRRKVSPIVPWEVRVLRLQIFQSGNLTNFTPTASVPRVISFQFASFQHRDLRKLPTPSSAGRRSCILFATWKRAHWILHEWRGSLAAMIEFYGRDHSGWCAGSPSPDGSQESQSAQHGTYNNFLFPTPIITSFISPSFLTGSYRLRCALYSQPLHYYHWIPPTTLSVVTDRNCFCTVSKIGFCSFESFRDANRPFSFADDR